MTATHYIGLMSGTSTDGVDAVLVSFTGCNTAPEILAAASQPMPAALRDTFLQLNQPGPNELEVSSLAANQLADVYANACNQLLRSTGLAPAAIRAIGAHGQTVRHRPDLGYTVQINAPARLAELTGIDVIADFRARDVAAGGQGAPLVPAFHDVIFRAEHPRVVLNLGGMANITLLQPGVPAWGFDTGPANVLLDLWCNKHTGQAFDRNGDWAASGAVCAPLLNTLLQDEPWFQLQPPKSTGRDQFNESWLAQRLNRFDQHELALGLTAADVQATLTALTARSVAQAIEQQAPATQEVLVCGGGAHNAALMARLRQDLPQCQLRSTAELGIAVEQVEALAFAWLAWAHDNRHPAGLPAVTGARHPTILGCRHFA